MASVEKLRYRHHAGNTVSEADGSSMAPPLPAPCWWTVNPGGQQTIKFPVAQRGARAGGAPCVAVSGRYVARLRRPFETAGGYEDLGMAFAQFRQRQLEGFTEQVVELVSAHAVIESSPALSRQRLRSAAIDAAAVAVEADQIVTRAAVSVAADLQAQLRGVLHMHLGIQPASWRGAVRSTAAQLAGTSLYC